MLLIGAAWAALAAFDIWLLLLRPDATWDAKIAFVLGLIGVYTFGFGVVSATGLLKQLPSMGEELTSPNPTRFLAGTFLLLSILQMALSIALSSSRTQANLDRRGGVVLNLVETPIILVGALVVTAFILIYLVLIAPLAWIAYTVASAPLDSILGSARDVEFASQSASGESESIITIKDFVREHLVTLRSLLVGVPALVSSLILDAPGLI